VEEHMANYQAARAAPGQGNEGETKEVIPN
jgi:hypothetical protein